MVASFKVKREARAPRHHCLESSQGGFCAVPWMPIASALAGPVPGLCLLHQMTVNIAFQPFQAAGWEPSGSFAGFIHPRAGSFSALWEGCVFAKQHRRA